MFSDLLLNTYNLGPEHRFTPGIPGLITVQFREIDNVVTKLMLKLSF